MKKNKRIAFIFTSSREGMMEKIKKGEMPDAPLRGMNHLREKADHFTIPSKSFASLLKVPRLLTYDFVITQDNLLLGFIVSSLAKIFRTRTKWLYMSINTSILIRRNKKKPIHLFFLKLFWKSYAHIMCISMEQIEDFMRLGIDRSRLSFVPYAIIDPRFFQAHEIPPNGEIILSVGRDLGRDHETLFKAAEQIPHPWIVATSKKLVPPDTVLPPTVSVFYDKDSPEVRDLLAKSRLLVVVSKHSHVPEGSDCSGQTVVLEALAAGVPVVATERAWMHDYFVSGEDLVVIEPNDVQAIVRAINELWDDEERRKRLAKSGHDKVHARYTTKNMAQDLERIMNFLE